MKCQFIREMAINIRRATDELKAAAIERVSHGKPQYFVPVGTYFTSPIAWFWVQQGCAVPADNECQIAANRTPEQLEKSQHAMDRMQAGIHPEDFEKWERGEILGYEMDGSYKLGPNWKEPEPDKDEEDW